MDQPIGCDRTEKGNLVEQSGRVYINRTRLRSKKERLEAGKKGLSERAFSILD